MENQYYIWVDGGVTSVGIINILEKKIVNPYMVVNMQYTVTEDGIPCNPNDPAAAKTKFKVDLVPYLFKEYLGKDFELSIDHISKFPHMITQDQESPLVKQYTEITQSL